VSGWVGEFISDFFVQMFTPVYSVVIQLPEARNRTLPPLTASSRSSTLPPLTSTLPSLDGAKMPTSLDKRKLPNAKFTQGGCGLPLM